MRIIRSGHSPVIKNKISSQKKSLSRYWSSRKPLGLTVLALTDTSVKVDWTNTGTADYDGHSIERSVDGITYAEVGTVNVGTNTFTDTVTADTYYYYRVRAYKGSNYSDYTDVAELEYGPEIVLNTDLSVDEWWAKGANISIADGVAHFTGVATAQSLSKSTVLTIGATYRVLFTIKNYSAGMVSANVGASSTAYRRSGNGTFELLITAVNASIYFSSANGPTTLDIDDISVKKKN